MTFAELFETYMAQHSRAHKRTADEDEDKFKRHIAKELGARTLSRISRRDVSALHVRLTKEAGPNDGALTVGNPSGAVSAWPVAA